MATRSIVPNATGEGSLGKEDLRWGDIQTEKLNNLKIPKDINEGDKRKALIVNDDEDGFVVGDAIASGNGSGFFTVSVEDDLIPLPYGSEFVQPIIQDIKPGDAGKIVCVNDEETAFRIFDSPVPMVDMQIDDAHKIMSVREDVNGYEHRILNLEYVLEGQGTVTVADLNAKLSDVNLDELRPGPALELDDGILKLKIGTGLTIVDNILKSTNISEPDVIALIIALS